MTVQASEKVVPTKGPRERPRTPTIALTSLLGGWGPKVQESCDCQDFKS